MLGLGGFYLGEPYRRRHMSMARAITRTCHESYVRSATKLGPETFRFNEQLEAEGLEPEAGYFLRPEVVESYFVMWRLTHDSVYREWGWEVVQALEKHCRVEGGGYSGLKDVNVDKPVKDDIQQSFFLAETLKVIHLYTTFLSQLTNSKVFFFFTVPVLIVQRRRCNPSGSMGV